MSRPRMRRANGEKVARLYLYIPSDIADQLRLRCVTNHQSLSDAVTDAIDRWLSSHEASGTIARVAE